jgi:hypothetical protein
MAQMTLDLSESLKARDLGISRASEPSWIDLAVHDFARFLRERGEATVEQWRYDWLYRGCDAPVSHKAYGAVAITAARRGLAVNTQRYVKAQSVKTHGHPVPIWRAP